MTQCPRNGCGGTLDEDGFCETCGLEAPAVVAAAPSAPAATPPPPAPPTPAPTGSAPNPRP